MLLAIPAAYALSVRPIGRWQDGLFFSISTKFLPVAASIIPVFLLLRSVNLLDNLWSLGLLYLGINLPLAVWMMRSFFSEVPRAVVEAAQIDGASYGRELWRVALPMVAPGAAAAALICFIFAWNEYFLANLLTAVVARTTPPFLGSFVDGRGQFLAILSAASTIAVLPVIVAGWLAQKQARPRPRHGRSEVAGCAPSFSPARGQSSLEDVPRTRFPDRETLWSG